MILLQIPDEGVITDSQGRKVDFKVSMYMCRSISIRSSEGLVVEYDYLFDK
jgi:hypothetical protein